MAQKKIAVPKVYFLRLYLEDMLYCPSVCKRGHHAFNRFFSQRDASSGSEVSMAYYSCHRLKKMQTILLTQKLKIQQVLPLPTTGSFSDFQHRLLPLARKRLLHFSCATHKQGMQLILLASYTRLNQNFVRFRKGRMVQC